MTRHKALKKIFSSNQGDKSSKFRMRKKRFLDLDLSIDKQFEILKEHGYKQTKEEWEPSQKQ